MASVDKKKEEVEEKVLGAPFDEDPQIEDMAFWDGVLDSLTTGSSDFIFPKEGRHRLRLVGVKKQGYYREVPSSYRGREKMKYLVPAVNLGEETEEESKLKYLIVPKTALKMIISLLKEGYPIFNNGPDGYGITLVRSGAGRDTSYSVLPSRKPFPLPEGIDPNEANLDEAAKSYVNVNSKSPRGESNEDAEAVEEEADEW